MHQQRFHRVARAAARGFGVEHDVDGFLRVGGFVQINVADAVQMLDNGHAGFRADAGNERFAAARNNHVNQIRQLQHRAHAVAAGVFHKAHGVFRQPRFAQSLLDKLCQRHIAVKCLAAAAQDAGVARFQAQCSGIHGYIRARFVNNADDTQRHAHFADAQTVGAQAKFVHFAHGVGQRGDLMQAIYHGFQAAFADFEAV